MVTKTAKAYGGLLSGTSASDTLHGLGGIDRIEGGAGDDTIDGGGSNDWLYGGAGIDTVTGGAGNDWIDGGDGDDTLSGGAGIDLLYGGAGNDRLDGGAGADVMTGGKGDDVYIVDHALDQVVETSGGGNDTVFSTVSFSLAGILPILDGLFQIRFFAGYGRLYREDRFPRAAGRRHVAVWSREDKSIHWPIPPRRIPLPVMEIASAFRYST